MNGNLCRVGLGLLGTMAAIGTSAIVPHLQSASAGSIQVPNPNAPIQINHGKLKVRPAWTISGEMQATYGKYSFATQNPSCDQFRVQAVSVVLVKPPGNPPPGGFVQSDVPKFIYPVQPIKLKNVDGQPFTQTLKCRYSISGDQYIGETIKFVITGPYSDINGPHESVVIPQLLQNQPVDLKVSLGNIG